jgi:ribosomal protein S8
MTARVADFCTRLRNASRFWLWETTAPHSQLLEQIAKQLFITGFIQGYQTIEVRKNIRVLKINLRSYNIVIPVSSVVYLINNKQVPFESACN